VTILDINDQFMLYIIITTVLAAVYGIFMTIKNKRSQAEKKDAEMKKQAQYNAKASRKNR
jgi:uncharacterized membrane protein (DUF106 family)